MTPLCWSARGRGPRISSSKSVVVTSIRLRGSPVTSRYLVSSQLFAVEARNWCLSTGNGHVQVAPISQPALGLYSSNDYLHEMSVSGHRTARILSQRWYRKLFTMTRAAAIGTSPLVIAAKLVQDRLALFLSLTPPVHTDRFSVYSPRPLSDFMWDRP